MWLGLTVKEANNDRDGTKHWQNSIDVLQARLGRGADGGPLPAVSLTETEMREMAELHPDRFYVIEQTHLDLVIAPSTLYGEWLRGANPAKTRLAIGCLLYTSPSPRDRTRSRMPSSA